MKFPNLDSVIKILVRQGIYSLYSVKGEDWYCLRVPPKLRCCNGEAAPSSDYKVETDGSIMDVIVNAQDLEFERSISLSEEDLGVEF